MNETRKYRGHTIVIEQDDIPLNPRVDYDNLGTMVCFHPDYNLGDKDHGFNEPQDLIDYLRREHKQLAVVLPLYLLDHSGLCMQTGPYACDPGGWDTSRVGVIFITKEKARKEYGWKLITKARQDKLEERLKGEVETYSACLEGNVYGYIAKDPDGNELESCWGYIGYPEESGVIEEAEAVVDVNVKKLRERHFYKLKAWLKHGVSLLKRWGAPEAVLA